MKIEFENQLAKPDSDKSVAPANHSARGSSSHSQRKEYPTESNLDQTDVVAENALRKVFDTYNPEKEDSDILFYSVAYDLNRLYRPDAPPENTGSLEKGIAKKIEPLLQELAIHYPSAVQRFRFLFCSEVTPQKSAHKYNPQVFIRDEQEALTYYLGRIKDDPQEVLDFASQAVASSQNNGLGIGIMKSLVEKMGWEYVVARMLPSDQSQPSEKRYFEELQECLHKLSSPATLATQHIEQLLSQTKNDTEWIGLMAYLKNRKSVEDVRGASSAFCRNLLRDHDIPFYDKEKTRAVAADILEENHEAYYGLLEELRFNIRRMYSNYDGEPDSQIVIDQMKQWERMSVDELLDGVPPAYAFNIIMAYVPDDRGVLSPTTLAESEKGELVRSLMLDEEALRKATKRLVSQDDTAYFTVLSGTEIQEKNLHTAASQCAQYNFIPILRMHAEQEKRTGPDQWGYILNSSVLTLAHNTLALYSPTGRPLGIYKIDGKNKSDDGREATDFLAMKHALSDTNNFTPLENAAAVMLLFWKRLPTDWQDHLHQVYDTFDIDLDDFVAVCPDSFELAVSFSPDITSLLSRIPEFVDALNRYVDARISEFSEEAAYPQKIDTNEFLVLMNTEYGQTTLTENDVKGVLGSLGFDTALFLQESLGFDFNQISRREFFSLILYLKSKNGGKGFSALQKFIGETENSDAKANRIKTFLSLEQGGQEMGETILLLGERLPQEEADKVFSRYASLVNNAEKNIAHVLEQYIESFPEASVNKGDVLHVVLQRAARLLVEAAEAPATEQSISRLLDALNKEDAAQTALYHDFELISKEITQLALEAREDSYRLMGIATKEDLAASRSWREAKAKASGITLADPTEIQALEKKNIHTIITETHAFLKTRLERLREDTEKSLPPELKEIFDQQSNAYGVIAKKIKAALVQRNALRKKFESIVYGHETAALPSELLMNLPSAVKEIKPEKIPNQSPAYFPVGISKNLPAWQEVLEGKAQFAKPIDIYSYLFWLENQNKEVELIVCDDMQVPNYQSLYGTSEAEARKTISLIGAAEKNHYEEIIKTFGLSHIRVVDYQEFKDRHTDHYEKYADLCRVLSKEPMWKKAFLSMVQDSLGEEAMDDATKEKYLPYAIEELSWILSTDGTKVSHLNEARYDILAAAIRNIETAAKESGADFLDPKQRGQLEPIICGVLDGLANQLNQSAAANHGTPSFSYYQKARKHIRLIERPKNTVPKKINKKDIVFNFVPPSIGSQSFGWRSAGTEQEGVINFREPYSTYFYRDTKGIFLESDQVMAIPEGLTSGKILTLSKEKQQTYAEQVLRPLLLHYFKALEQAPQEYFSDTQRTRSDLLEECQAAKTLSDILNFIQKYIVRPSTRQTLPSIVAGAPDNTSAPVPR